ncbi:T3SS (YopN, CesT) and YbjN peptide-binding chaperone 1 [Deinococcus yavapaiensis]|uniref:Putative sensory transduction regulator n=1 Tax=Deinococcus yavapaiensis KR-236 TaxID=694435 RepID=A0A318S3M2_9DEIO|nr:YbjN domain-containing protein [Deinococcus yavapaiensis]PYE52035.1 putative sensory transduction regulator [Deinococcus yavapaiensis KR-236]
MTQLEAVQRFASHAERIAAFLRDEGFRPTVDEDGDVYFKFEGRVYYVVVNEEDPSFFRVLAPFFWSLDDADERRRALTVTNEVQCRFKVGRFFVSDDGVSAVVDAYLPDETSFRAVLLRSLSALPEMTREFRDRMHAHSLS